MCIEDNKLILNIIAKEYKYLQVEVNEPVVDGIYYYKTYITRGDLKDKNIYNLSDIKNLKLPFLNNGIDVKKIYLNDYLIYPIDSKLPLCE